MGPPHAQESRISSLTAQSTQEREGVIRNVRNRDQRDKNTADVDHRSINLGGDRIERTSEKNCFAKGIPFFETEGNEVRMNEI